MTNGITQANDGRGIRVRVGGERVTDWPAIKAAFEAGEGVRALGRQFGPSHTQIRRRSLKEAWARSKVQQSGTVPPQNVPDEPVKTKVEYKPGTLHGGTFGTPEHEVAWERTKSKIKFQNKDAPGPMAERLERARRYHEWHVREFGYAQGALMGAQGVHDHVVPPLMDD